MPIIDCTPRVRDVRAVRAAAYLPFVTGLVFLVFAAPLAWIDSHDARQAATFLALSLTLLVIAAAMKRGVFLAALLLAVGLALILATLLPSLAQAWHGPDAPGTAATVLGFGAVALLAFRAVAASWRLRRGPWRSARAETVGSALARWPNDHRLGASLAPFLSAVAVYVLGIVAALLVAVVTGIGVLAGLALLPFALVGSRLVQRARRTLALRAAEVRSLDPRPPMLLVRSFVDDLLELKPRLEYFGGLLRKRLTLEEFLVDRLSTRGPVVAIGRPGESLSPLGAAREYVHGPDWQERVTGLLGECEWVVAILGSGDGLKWEYEQIAQRGLAARFVLVVPPVAPEAFRERWDLFAQAFPLATGVDLTEARRLGGAMCAIFPEGREPVLFCSKYRNETAYDVVMSMLFVSGSLPLPADRSTSQQ